jgi:histidine triad (HIT) family protein
MRRICWVGLVFALVCVYLLGRLDWKGFFGSSMDCAFCDSEVLNRQVFYRGRVAIGLVTYKPAVRGHVLVIPKRHVLSFHELTGEELSEIQEIVQRVHELEKELYGTSSYLLLQKNGQEAGQSVPHVHFHYLPRGPKDGPVALAFRLVLAPWFRPLTHEEIEAQVSALVSVRPANPSMPL